MRGNKEREGGKTVAERAKRVVICKKNRREARKKGEGRFHLRLKSKDHTRRRSGGECVWANLAPLYTNAHIYSRSAGGEKGSG